MVFDIFGDGENRHHEPRLWDLTGKGLKLLEELDRLRQDQPTRPILLVCYSFGTYVAKDVS
jgi:hypothetical protein